jgi:hypothetical protein
MTVATLAATQTAAQQQAAAAAARALTAPTAYLPMGRCSSVCSLRRVQARRS